MAPMASKQYRCSYRQQPHKTVLQKGADDRRRSTDMMEADKGEKSARERRIPRKSEHAFGTAASEPRRGPKSCSSHYKGVTKHRRTGRWEAHIWGRSVNKGPGKQIYLGGFVTPEEAAEAHDLAALQLQGPTAKTNFHISKCAACKKPQRKCKCNRRNVQGYAEWLATLQATPSEDNLPLQLRRAGMFKRCTDRAKQQPGFGPQGQFHGGEPNTPLNAEVKARLSRASDSTQTAEVAASNAAYFEREESVNSQSSGQGGPQPGTIRRPLPMRLGMSMGAGDGRNGADNNQGNNLGPQQAEVQPTAQAQRQASGGPQILPSRSVAVSGGQNPLLTAPYLNSRVVPQLVPLGWKSFQALAEEQAQAEVAAHAAQQGAEGAAGDPPQNPIQIAPLLSTTALPPQFYQMPPEGPSFMNTSANGGIVYGHKQYLGFLSPEQVRWLEASGVKFPEHLRTSSPQLSRPGSMAAENPGFPQGFLVPAQPGGLIAFSGGPQPFSMPPQPFLPPPHSLIELQQSHQPYIGFHPPAFSAPQPTLTSEDLPPLEVAAANENVQGASEPEPMDCGEDRLGSEGPGIAPKETTAVVDETPEESAADKVVADKMSAEQAQLVTEQAANEGPVKELSGKELPGNEQPEKETVVTPKQQSPPPETAAEAEQKPGKKTKKASHEDKQIVEALLGLRSAK